MTNSRFEDLERRCQKIKRARIAKIVLFFLLISLSTFGYFYFTLKVDIENSISMLPPLVERNTTKLIQEVKIELPQESKEEVPTLPTEDTINLEKESYDTIKLAPTVKYSSKKVTISAPVEEKINLEVPGKLELQDFSNKEEKTPQEIKKMINMSVKSLGNEETLLKNFHSNNNFKTTLDVAQFYFDSKEYTKAISWSKDASKFDPISDKPWIIYAKSKYSLGEKAEAIRSLEVFLGYFSSKDAKDLLNFYKGPQ